jgi:hypothetical protein
MRRLAGERRSERAKTKTSGEAGGVDHKGDFSALDDRVFSPIDQSFGSGAVGRCMYCGKPAGFLHSQCKDCVESRAVASTRIPQFFAEYLTSDMTPGRFKSYLEAFFNWVCLSH